MNRPGMVTVGIFGTGRLGGVLAGAIERAADLELRWTLGRTDAIPADVDVAIDASLASAVPGHLAWAEESGTTMIIGTTGWDRSILADVSVVGRAWAGSAPAIGVMVAPNFSLAVAFLRRAALTLGRLASLEPDADLSVVERHHRAKVDSPSGTAKALADALAQGSRRRVSDLAGRSDGRAIGIASLRSGGAVGFHELRYEAPAETLLLSHEAYSRDVFASGALAAVRWMHGRRGLYSFDDMAADMMNRVFAPTEGLREEYRNDYEFSGRTGRSAGHAF